MLYLTRREGQAVVIDDVIEVRVVEVRGRSVKLGLTFPANVSVLREEVFLEVQRENQAAAESSGLLGAELGLVEPGGPSGDESRASPGEADKGKER
jgi:carbon storage regulator